MAVLHSSEEATTLLARADQGARREDWKLVIDSLQRIIELPTEHLLTSDGRVYESARRHGQRRIAALPPAGLRAYRLLYDGQAFSLLAQAQEQHDETMLKALVDELLMTSVGDEAAVTLADWLIDEGRFSQALAYLQQVRTLYPDSDLPGEVIPMRMAICLAGMGRGDQAAALLEEVTARRPATASVGERVPTDRSRKQLADRLKAVSAYIRHPMVRDQPSRSQGWPTAYGNVSRNAAAAAMEPAFLSDLPWTVPLSIAQFRTYGSAIREYAQQFRLLPMTQMVTDGRVLVVRAGTELAALDSLTFEPIWRVDTYQRGIDEDSQSSQPKQPQSDPRVLRLFSDHVAGGVAIAFDLALTIEWPGDISAMHIRSQQGKSDRFSAQPNGVVAHSLVDGSRAWISDTVSGEGALGPVQFLSAPIPINEYLLAPCRVGSDLYAVLLHPASGKLVRSIYLCGTGGGGFNLLEARMVCLADGVLYVATGRGVLIALETGNFSICWAVRYDPTEENAKATAKDKWLPSPPIAVADVVLLAPTDSQRLFCFDRVTGDVRWSVERSGSIYPLGATNHRIWLVGDSVRALDVETGRTIWEKPCGTPAGRGTRTGDRLYLPTFAGLAVLAAQTGEPICSPIPFGTTAPGNLLAWDGALYSVSAIDIRKYPDLNRGYSEAVAAYASNPSDPAQAIRRAWLEYLKDQPAKALAVLEQLPPTLQTDDGKRHKQVAHLRVLAMLELVASSKVSSGKALALLTAAQRIAETPQDKMDSVLALGEFHRQQGRLLDASRLYLSLALSDACDLFLSDERGGFERRARIMLGQRLADIARQLSKTEAHTLQAEMRRRLGQAAQQHDEKTVRRLAQADVSGDVGREAELVLAIWAAQELRYEQAESLLLRVIRQATLPKLQACAIARLASLYLEPDELHQPVSASRWLDRLQKEFTGTKLAANLLDTPWSLPWDNAAARSQTVPAARLAEALRKRIDADVLARHAAALENIRLSEPSEATMVSYRTARPLVVRGPRIEPMADMRMLLAEERMVEARAREDDRLLWPAALRLLGELAVERKKLALEPRFVRPVYAGYVPRAHGVAEGQTLVVNTSYGIHAVGMLTGRRLWSRPFAPPQGAQEEASGSDSWLWNYDGYVLSVNTYGCLEVSRVDSGDRILWRQTMPNASWHAVRARGPYVAVVDAGFQLVNIFHLADGRCLGECRFKQASDPYAKVSITLYDEVICGPISGSEVAAFELATPGVERWRVSMPTDLAALFKPTPGLLAITDGSGGVQVIDPNTGKSLMRTRVSACAAGIRDGFMADGVLFVCGWKKLLKDPKIGYDRQRWGLAAVDMPGGTVRWEHDDIGARAFLSAEVLKASSNAIPLAVLVPAGHSLVPPYGEARINPSRNQVALTILHKATGQPIGPTIWAPLGKGTGDAGITDVQVWPGQVIVVAGSTHLRFGIGLKATPVGQASRTSISDGSEK